MMSHILTVAMSSSSLRPIRNSQHSRASHQVDGSALSDLSSLHRLWISDPDFYRNRGFSFLYSLGLMSLGQSKQPWLRALPPLQAAYCCHVLTACSQGLFSSASLPRLRTPVSFRGCSSKKLQCVQCAAACTFASFEVHAYATMVSATSVFALSEARLSRTSSIV